MKKLILFGILFIALGITVFGVALVKLDFNFYNLNSIETKVYEFDGSIENLKIQMDTSDVEILPSKDNKLKVEIYKKENREIFVNFENGTLHVKEEEKKWYEYLDIDFVAQEEKAVIYLPTEFINTIDIEADTSDVKISKLNVNSYNHKVSTGDVQLNEINMENGKFETTTGDMEFKKVNVKNALIINATTGDITLDNVNAQKIAVKVDTGDTTLTSCIAETISLEADTGDMNLTRTVANKDLTIETNSGYVTFSLCDGGMIKISTDTGDVEGTFLKEKKLNITTNTGDIVAPNITTDGKECIISTDTGDVKISFAK